MGQGLRAAEPAAMSTPRAASPERGWRVQCAQRPPGGGAVLGLAAARLGSCVPPRLEGKDPETGNLGRRPAERLSPASLPAEWLGNFNHCWEGPS